MSTTENYNRLKKWAKDAASGNTSKIPYIDITDLINEVENLRATIAATEAAKATGTAGELPRIEDVTTWGFSGDKLGFAFGPMQNGPYVTTRDAVEYGQACAEAARIRNPKFSAEDIEAMIQGRAAEIAAARQPAPAVAVKTWRERYEPLHNDCHDRMETAIDCMKAEIAELRAALDVTNRSQP